MGHSVRIVRFDYFVRRSTRTHEMYNERSYYPCTFTKGFDFTLLVRALDSSPTLEKVFRHVRNKSTKLLLPVLARWYLVPEAAVTSGEQGTKCSTYKFYFMSIQQRHSTPNKNHDNHSDHEPQLHAMRRRQKPRLVEPASAQEPSARQTGVFVPHRTDVLGTDWPD